jgi:hypothetical protein
MSGLQEATMMADQLRPLADAERAVMQHLSMHSLAARPTPPCVLTCGIGSGGSLKRRCEMILNGQTTLSTGRVAGVLLLLVAIGVLPLAAVVRAHDESDKHRDLSVKAITQPGATTGHRYLLIADPQVERKLRQLCRTNQLHDLAEALRTLRIVGVRRSDGRDESGQKRKYSRFFIVPSGSEYGKVFSRYESGQKHKHSRTFFLIDSPELRKVFLKYSQERSKHKP